MRAEIPSGEVWAWQAKYLFDLGDNKFSQLDRSAREALRTQPKLTRYIFMLPYNRPAAVVCDKKTTRDKKSAMAKWGEYAARWTTEAAASGRQVTFVYLGESELLRGLTEASQAGRLYYWFRAYALTPQWCADAVERAIEGAGDRYTPAAHVVLPITELFDGLSRNERIQDKLRAPLRTVRERRDLRTVRELSKDDPELVAALGEADRLLDTADSALTTVNIVETLESVPIEAVSTTCQTAKSKLREVSNALTARARSADSGPQTRQAAQRLTEASHRIWRLIGAVSDIVDAAESDAIRLVNIPALLLTGAPGVGKTHILCDIAQSRISESLPTVLLLGQNFNRGDPWSQILRMLDLDCTFEAFLGALSTAAELAGQRAFLMIDTLNEGSGPDLWPDYLPQLLQWTQKWPWVGVVLSCRTNYVETVISKGLDETKLVRVEHYGFAGHEYEAARIYFRHYQLQLPDFPLLAPEFGNPLFLKLMCQGLSAQGKLTLPRGTSGISTIFDTFLSAVDARLAKPDRCDYDYNSHLVKQAVQALAGAMNELGEEQLTLGAAQQVTDNLLPSTTATLT